MSCASAKYVLVSTSASSTFINNGGEPSAEFIYPGGASAEFSGDNSIIAHFSEEGQAVAYFTGGGQARARFGLVCSVGSSNYEVLWVDEGPLITVNNEYILVLKWQSLTDTT